MQLLIQQVNLRLFVAVISHLFNSFQIVQAIIYYNVSGIESVDEQAIQLSIFVQVVKRCEEREPVWSLPYTSVDGYPLPSF